MSTSQYDYDYDDDSNNEGGQQRSNKGNSLRDKLEAALAENKTLKERVQAAEATARETTVSALVKEKGLNPKVAKLMPKDVEPTSDAIGKWLDEWGDLFAPEKAEKETENPPTDDDGDGSEDDADGYGAAMMRIQQTQGSMPGGKQSELLQKLRDPNLSREELMGLVTSAGGGYGVG